MEDNININNLKLNYIKENIDIDKLELNLIEYGYDTNAGSIDILCEDDDENLIPIKVKFGKVKNICQILGYMKAINAERGIIIAQDFSDDVKFIAEDFDIDLVNMK